MRISVLVLLFTLMLPSVGSAQIFQKDKYPTKFVKGTKYYVHIVEQGHTIYAISKKYAVKMEHLLTANRGIEDGLQIGEEILIPTFRINRQIARRYTPELKGKYLIHVVQRKETLYSISKSYGVETNVIKGYNPILDEGLKVGQEIRIPVESREGMDAKWTNPAGTENDDRFIYHEVFKQETLYSLSKLYGVSVNQIRALNDGLPGGLKVGETIRIPRIQHKIEQLDSNSSQKRNTPFFNDNPNLAYKDVYEIALLIPFNAEQALSSGKLSDNQFGVEFYNGFKMASQELIDKSGSTFNVKVFDTEGDAITTKKLLTSNQLQNVDLFVGPMFKAPLIEVLDFARTSGGRVICPVQQNPKLLQNNRHLTNIWPSNYVQMQNVAAYLGENHTTENIVVLASDSLEDVRITYAFKQSMNRILSNSLRRYKDSVTVVSASDFDLDKFTSVLDKEEVNNIVFPSIDVLVVTELLNKISDLYGEYKIRVFGTETWFNFRQIDESYLERFEVHLPAGVFIDYDNPLDQKFLKNYRDTYSTEPGKFGYLGYNTGLYFIQSLNEFGLIFSDVYDQMNTVTPNMLMNLKQATPQVGYQNHGSQLLKFKNLQWNKIAL
ncbi:MAG: LysM repeat protein [Sphingobacteriales bacterium]|jgi:LysM repeat protein